MGRVSVLSENGQQSTTQSMDRQVIVHVLIIIHVLHIGKFTSFLCTRRGFSGIVKAIWQGVINDMDITMMDRLKDLRKKGYRHGPINLFVFLARTKPVCPL